MTNEPGREESVDISWQLDETTIEGTLVKPSGEGPFPAIVMVAGSGPTDRDWNSPLVPGTNGSAHLLAAALAQAGFASLRYDKRASGPHAREYAQTHAGNISMQSHLDELEGAVRTLANQRYVRKDHIFGLGNSEGTLHVLNYQVSRPSIPFAGVILVGPPGRSVGAVARAQLAPQAALLPNGDELLAFYDAAIDRFVAGEPAAPDPALPQDVQTVIRSLESPFNQPFARELWQADAVAPLTQVDVPVLVMIGKKDLQVDWQADGEPLQRSAAAGENVTFSFPETANHVLKYEPKPRSELILAEAMKHYNATDVRLDSDALAIIVDWLAKHS